MINVLAWIRGLFRAARGFERSFATGVAPSPLVSALPVPEDILDLLPDSYHKTLALRRWLRRYEDTFQIGWLPRSKYERVIYSILSLGTEPTGALELYRVCLSALWTRPPKEGI